MTVLLIAITLTFTVIKYNQIKTEATNITSNVPFPVDKNEDLFNRAKNLNQLINQYNVDLMVHKAGGGMWWANLHDSYAYNPLNYKNDKLINSVYLENDRRTWLYEDYKNCTNLLLFGTEISDSTLNQFQHKRIDGNTIWIKNNSSSTDSLMRKLNLFFGLK